MTARRVLSDLMAAASVMPEVLEMIANKAAQLAATGAAGSPELQYAAALGEAAEFVGKVVADMAADEAAAGEPAAK